MDKMTKLFALAAFSLTAYQQMVLADYRPEWQSNDATSAPANSRQGPAYSQSTNRDSNQESRRRKEPSLREDRRLLRDERHVIRDENRLERDERKLLRDDFRLKKDENRLKEENRGDTAPKFTSPEATPKSYPLSDWPPKASKNDSKAEQYSRSSDADNDDNDSDDDTSDQDNREDVSYHNHMGTPRSYQYENERNGDRDSKTPQPDNRSSYNSGHSHSHAHQLISEATTPAAAHPSKKVHFNRPHEMTIVDIATNDPSLSTFVQALQASDLSQVLAGKGPFTVFAPDNQAFKKISPIQLSDLLKPENKQKLTTFLKNHVIAGKILAADIKEGHVTTANGKELTIKKTGTKVTVNGANVTKTDLTSSNGVVHIIDAVLVP